MRNRLLLAGCHRVIILGLPNREPYNTSAPDIATTQGHLDFCNTGFAGLAATNAQTDYHGGKFNRYYQTSCLCRSQHSHAQGQRPGCHQYRYSNYC